MGFDAVGTLTNVGEAGTTEDINIPSHSSGDLLILAVCQSSNGNSPAAATNTPSGWTLADDGSVTANVEAGNASAVRATIFWKSGNGSETSVTVTFGASVGCFAQVAACSGMVTAGDIASVGLQSQESGVDITADSASDPGGNYVVVRLFCFDDDFSTDADHDSDGGWNGTSRAFGTMTGPSGSNGLAAAWAVDDDTGAISSSVFSSNGDTDAAVAITAVFLATSGPTISDIETDEEFDNLDTGITITGTTFEASQGTGKVELGDDPDYGTATKVEQTVTSWADTSIDFTVDLSTLTPGALWIFVTNDSDDLNDPGFAVTVHRAVAFALKSSANISASGEDTTAQLTAPAAGSFGGGRIQDDENPGDTVNLADGEYREDETCFEATANSETAQYEFRILLEGVVIDTYTVTPKWTVTAGTIYNETATLTAAGAIPRTGTLTMTPSLSLAGDGTVAESGLFVANPSLALAADSTLTPLGTFVASVLATLTADHALPITPMGVLNLLATLTSNATTTETHALIREGLLALAGNATTTETNLADLMVTIALTGDGTITPAGVLIMNTSLALAADGTVSDLGGLLLEAELTLAAVATLTALDFKILNESISLSSNAATTLTNALTALGTLALAANSTTSITVLQDLLVSLALAADSATTMAGDVFMIYNEVLALDANATTTTAGQRVLAETLALAVGASITAQTNLFIDGLISLGVDATTAETAGLEFNAVATLASAATLASTSFVQLAGIGNVGVLSASALLQNSIALVGTGLTQPSIANVGTGLTQPSLSDETLTK